MQHIQSLVVWIVVMVHLLLIKPFIIPVNQICLPGGNDLGCTFCIYSEVFGLLILIALVSKTENLEVV